jgi:DNA-binding MarR family transcriptional regulator
VFNVTAMERSILAELSERGGRGQLSRFKDRRPIERLVNKGFVERRTLNSDEEEYVLTAIGKKVLDNKLTGTAHGPQRSRQYRSWPERT